MVAQLRFSEPGSINDSSMPGFAIIRFKMVFRPFGCLRDDSRFLSGNA